MRISKKSGKWAFIIGLIVTGILISTIVINAFRQKSEESTAQAAREIGTSASVQPPENFGEASRMTMDDWRERIDSANPGEFARLMQDALRIGDATLRKQVVADLLVRWMDVDLRGLSGYMDAIEVDEGDGSPKWAILYSALAEALPRISEQTAMIPKLMELIQRMVAYYAVSQPDLALQWARQWLLDDTLASALSTIAQESAKTSPGRANEILAEIKSQLRRIEAISGIGKGIAESDPQQAIIWAETFQNPTDRTYAMNGVLSVAAHQNPEVAADTLNRFRDRLEKEYAAQVEADRAAMGITARDELNDPDSFDSGIIPPKVSPDLQMLADASSAIAENLAAQDPQKALAWADSLPEGALSNAAKRAAVTAWAAKSPWEAVAYVKADADSDSETVGAVFQIWAEADPRAAASAVTGQIGERSREDAIGGVVAGWMMSADAASEVTAWIDSLPPGRDQDLANRAIVEVISLDESEMAWQRALTIKDEQDRTAAMTTAFAGMVEQDPAMARMAFERVNVSPETAEEFSRMLEAVSGTMAN